MTVRVLIVDDQEMIRVGLRTILDRQDGLEVAGEAGDGLEALKMLDRDPVDVVLMDIRMPGIDGVEATRRIRLALPAERVRILVLTTFEHDQTVLAALRAGANGYLSKAAGPAELVQAIQEVADGGGALSAKAAAALIEHVADQPAVIVDDELAARFQALTPRERDIVIAVAQGIDNEAIATALFISAFTVKTHANRAMNKVGARDRAQLVAFAYRAGLTA
jgi:DNA-binding NarL/FixJ family response regulator